MADKSHSTTAPHSSTSTTSPLNPPHTPRSTSIPDDSETEFEPTPLHSPGGPQYEDLPPSYDFALSDARNGAASLDASQIEAHRVSANEGPDEPEVWEYRMRGESTGAEEELHEHEEAPAYEGHVPVQHVASSDNIPVGRVGDFSASLPAGSRSVPVSEDPPHSVPDVGPGSGSNAPVGRGDHRGQPWTPFGAPGYGPFGAPGNGPFGAPDNGSSGRGRGFGQRGCGGRPGRGRHGRGARAGSSQDWAAFGQNMGRWGEELGRRMGNWGEQFGRQAGAMGQQLGRDSGAWAAAYSGRVTGVQATPPAGPSNAETSEPPRYDEPPSYQGPAGVAHHEAGVVHSDRKVDVYPQEKAPMPSPPKKTVETPSDQHKFHDDDDDDDDSSISSDSSSSSSSSSDNLEDDHDTTQANFLARIESINKAAEIAASKGKKSREEIEHERDLAIAQATREKEASNLKIARKHFRRTQKRELRARKRELTREYRQKKHDLRAKAGSEGKGKGKAKKGADWKEVKREYKAKRRALKRERVDAKRQWKKERREGKSGVRAKDGGEGSLRDGIGQDVLNEKA